MFYSEGSGDMEYSDRTHTQDVNIERDKTKIYKSIYKIEENSLEKIYKNLS